MMGRKHREQASLFYEFRLDDMIPKGHLLRRINVFVTSGLGDLHELYSNIGRPSIDPELLIRMFIVGYCFGIRSERKDKLCKSTLKTKPLICYEVWMSGNAISLRLNKGDTHFIGNIEKHGTN